MEDWWRFSNQIFALKSLLSRKNPKETQGVVFRTILSYSISGLVVRILNSHCVGFIQILRYLNLKLKFWHLHYVFLFSLNLETLGTKRSYSFYFHWIHCHDPNLCSFFVEKKIFRLEVVLGWISISIVCKISRTVVLKREQIKFLVLGWKLYKYVFCFVLFLTILEF